MSGAAERPLTPDPDAREAGRKIAVERQAPRRSTVAEWSSGARPFFDVHQGIYRASWPNLPVSLQLEFDYLSHSRSSGDITAELLIVVDDPAGKGHYQRTRLNLLADRSVTSLAKSLHDRMPEHRLDWPDLLNQAVQWVLTEYRQGDPAVLLPDVPEPDGGIASLMPPLLAEDGPTMVFGDGGAGKSQLMLAVAASLHAGVEIIPGFTPTEQRNVVYLDWEWSAYIHKRRLQALWQGFEGPPPNIIYVACRLPLREERDRIRRIIRDHNVGFAVIDSVGYACGGSPSEDEVALNFITALRQLELPSLSGAHITKLDAKGIPEKPYGSTFWGNSMRKTWYVRGSDADTDGSLLQGLYNPKVNEGRKQQPIGLRWNFDEGRTWVQQSRVESAPDLAEQLPLGKRITLLLRGGPMTIADIASELNATVDTVRTTLRRGAGRYYHNFPGKGGNPATWGLAARDEE